MAGGTERVRWTPSPGSTTSFALASLVNYDTGEGSATGGDGRLGFDVSCGPEGADFQCVISAAGDHSTSSVEIELIYLEE